MSINKVIYDGNTLIDLTEDTVDASNLLVGYTAPDRSGAVIHGSFDPSLYVEKAGDIMTGALHIVGSPTTCFLEVSNVDQSSSGPRALLAPSSLYIRSLTSGNLNYGSFMNSGYIYVSTSAVGPSVENSKTGVELSYNGTLDIVYQESNTYKKLSLPDALKTSSGTATRNTTNASAGICSWSKWGRIVSVTVTGVSLTEDAANNSNIFTGLPNAAEQTNCIAMGNTSGCTRWYVTTGGALRVGAMALRTQTIYLNFTYIAES